MPHNIMEFRCSALFLVVSALAVAVATASANPPKTRDDFCVQGLDEIEPAFGHYPGDMYAGTLPVDHDEVKGEMMFWLFAPDDPLIENKKTLTVWLNGGPGCSSFFAGLLFEHGPATVPLQPAGTCCIDEHAPLVYNPHSWALSTHMLYVEQPISVGFSSGSPLPQNETDVGADFYAFLQNFFTVFDEYQDDDYEVYIFGESYAGMYVPSIARYIHLQNKKQQPTSSPATTAALHHIPLAGIGIGNGLLDSRVQGPIRIDYAFFHGMIDTYTRNNLHLLWDLCINPENDMQEPIHSFNVPDDCGMLAAIPLASGQGVAGNGPNIYDVTTWDPYAVLLGDNNTISRFYNNPKVKQKIHAPMDKFWQGCLPGGGRRRRRLSEEEDNEPGASFLINDKPISTVPYIGELLDDDIRVLMYNGDRDMACNPAGTEILLNSMEWKGSEGWYTSPRGLWMSSHTRKDKAPAGYTKSHLNLDFVVVYGSGHLAPYNQPATSLDLLNRFLDNKSFQDIDLPNFGDHVKQFLSTQQTSKSSTAELSSSSQASIVYNSPLSQRPASLSSTGMLVPLSLAFVAGFGLALFWQQRRRRRNNGGYETV